MDKPTPRVNSARLNDYHGSVVRIAGKVIQLQGSTAIIEASDGGQVTITLNPDSHFSDEYVEVLGRVQKDNVVMELASSNLGENYDLKLSEAVVQLSHSRPDMFPTA